MSTEAGVLTARISEADLLAQRAAQERRARTLRLIDRIAVIAAIIAVWEGAVAIGLIHPLFISQPSSILTDLFRMVSSGYIFPHLAVTVYEAITGLVFGTILGMAIGFLAAISKRVSDALQPVLVAFNSMPRIAIAPLFIIWFGFGPESKIGLVTLVAFFITFFNTFSGVKSVDPALVNSIRAMGGQSRHVLTMVVLPVTSAWVFAALKSSISNALVAAVVGEFVGSISGIGWIMVQASGTLNTTRLFSTLIIMALVGSLLFTIVRWVEERVLRWRPNAEF